MQDGRNPHINPFSRGTTPPVGQQSAHDIQSPTSQIPIANHPHSISVDSLFRNINTAPAPPTTFYSPPPQSHSPPIPPSTFTPPAASDGGRISPRSHHSEGHTYGGVTSPNPSNSERQTALLSLLGPAAPPSQAQSQSNANASNQRQTSNMSESQGKMLLEQLMGNPSEQQQQPSQSSYQYEDPQGYSQQQHPFPGPQHGPPSPNTQSAQPHSDPERQSRFDFVSPFDALSSSIGSQQQSSVSSAGAGTVGPAKKKPVPSFPGSSGEQTSPRSGEEYSQLPNQQQQQQVDLPPVGPVLGGYGAYPENLSHIFHSSHDYGMEPPSSGGSNQYQSSSNSQRPLPMPPQLRQPLNQQLNLQASSPPLQSSPPRVTALQPQNRPNPIESPIPVAANIEPPQMLNTRDDSSPSPAAAIRNAKKEDAVARGKVSPPGPAKAHRVPVPSDRPLSSPTYVLDVLTPLQTTLAPHGLISVTPIALLKLDPLYLPGTTIGVSSFIAYAMTKGRVRLIARSNGARALLKLPPTFPLSTSVQDMAVSGNRLACVTNDGGCVVWEVLSSFDDDTQSKTLLHVMPTPGPSGFKSVKWHPKQPGTLAIASDRQIHLLNVTNVADMFHGEAIEQEDLSRVSNVFSIPSSLVSFTFDVPQIAIASISVDSTVTLWSMKDRLPFWSGRVPGDGLPSSIDFLEGGIIIGRKQGTVLQLLPVMSTTVCSTIKFVLGTGNKKRQNQGAESDEEQMFGHISYDPKIRTLWVANSARASLFAIRVSFDSTPPPPNSSNPNDAPTIRPSFDQIVEFPTTMQCINMTVLGDNTSATDSPGSQQMPLSPQDQNLAVAVFAVHTGGVDQVNITRDSFEGALQGTAVKLPPPAAKPRETTLDRSETGKESSGGEGNVGRRQPPPQQAPPPTQSQSQQQSQQQQPPPQQPRTLASIGQGLTENRGISDPEPNTAGTSKQTGRPNKKDNKKPAETKTPPDVATNTQDDSTIVSGFAKEFKKAEETLHNRLARLISKELEKQHQRLEDLRHEDQAADFNRQEVILKLISHELTKNTTRVVELAVKSEIQNSVLPALESVTKSEVKAALSGQIAKGVTETMKQTLPTEIERMLMRPDVSNHVARTFSSAITPIVERNVKDSINNTLIPAYSEATSAMHQELSREIHSEILNLRKEVITWQADALKGTESIIRDMEHSLRSLTEQVKILSLQIPSVQSQSVPARISPGPGSVHGPQTQQNQHMHMQHMPPHMRTQSHPTQQSMTQPLTGPSGMSQMTYGPPPTTQPTWIPAPPMQQQQQPSSMPPSNQQQSTPPVPTRPTEDWDETFLSTLATQDPKKLRELLQRCNPGVIMPPQGSSPLSQAVILTLVHRLSSSLAELSPVDESFKSGLWWLQRAAHTLSSSDPVIAPYVNRVLQTAQSILGTTASRLSLLPGGPSLMETNSMISQIQQTLASKTISLETY